MLFSLSLAFFATSALLSTVHAQSSISLIPTASWNFVPVQTPGCAIIEPSTALPDVDYGDTVDVVWSCPNQAVQGASWNCSCYNSGPNKPGVWGAGFNASITEGG